MEIDLELPSCDEDKSDTRLVDKDVNVVNEKKSEHVKESVASVQDQYYPSNVETRLVDIVDEMNVEKSSDDFGEVHALNANISASDGVVNVVDKGVVVHEPGYGLEFETKEDAYAYYKEYARSVGFGITIVASRRSKKTGMFIDIKLSCSRYRKQEGGDTENQRVQGMSTGCKAGVQMKKREDEKWYIHGFVNEHNHEIPISFVNSFGGRNRRPATVVCQKKGLQFALDQEDVRVMFEQLMCMQGQNPNFFYAIDFDNDKRLKSVFWVDANGRRDYNSFCDVVLFDTYYVRNNYKIPLVPIVGVNNHFQYILLGCALIGEETFVTFVWLMRTWLKAVGGQAPRVVITDQDKYLKEAVADVFTETCHRFCLWHVLTRIHEKVGSINEHTVFLAKLNKCIYQSWTVEQFEQRWWKLINRFESRENEFLGLLYQLYEDRKHWAPTYMQDMCSAGMSTVERAGSIASFFDRYISRETTAKVFMEHYKAFLKDRYEMEANVAFEAHNKKPELRSVSPFAKQMSTLYTDTIFRKFQAEVLGVHSCHLQKEGQDEETVTFWVDDMEERQNFIVAWNEPESRVCCLCHSFEYNGFLCRHALLVLHMSGVSRIPSNYILKRWMKDARVGHSVSDVSERLNCRVQRFNDLSKLAVRLGAEGSLSPETYQTAVHALDEVLKQCVSFNKSLRGVSESNAPSSHGTNDAEEVNYSGGMAKLSKKKKTHRKRKGQTEPEDIPIRLQDSCQMKLMNQGAHNLDSRHVPQLELQGELGSQGRAQDSCYGAQQSMPEMGRLNSVSPLHDGYYGNQQASQGHLHSAPTLVGHYATQLSMQVMIQRQLGFRASAVHSSDTRETLKDVEQSATSSCFPGNTSEHPHNKQLRQ